MADTNDIWKNDKGNLPQEMVLAYLEGKLSPEEQHAVEIWLAEEGIEGDALEGLKALPISDTRLLLANLNNNLRKQINRKKKHRIPVISNYWSLIAVITILLLCILAYIVINIAI